MKKWICILFFLSPAAGCSDKPSDSGGTPQTEGYTLFAANVEALDFWNAQTRDHLWSQGDYIGVYGSTQGENERYILKQSGYGQRGQVEFYGPKVKGDIVLAYYPFDEAQQGGIGALPMTIAQTQNYSENPYDQFLATTLIFARYDASGDETLGFEYPLGCLGISIEYEVVVKRISVTSNARKLSGRSVVDENLHISVTGSGSNTTTLDCGGGVYSAPDEIKTFYIMLPPGLYADRELTIVVETDPATDNFSAIAKEIRIDRLSITQNQIAAITIGGSLPGFETDQGILE